MTDDVPVLAIGFKFDALRRIKSNECMLFGYWILHDGHVQYKQPIRTKIIVKVKLGFTFTDMVAIDSLSEPPSFFPLGAFEEVKAVL